MKLEPANIVCPNCGSGNYMRHLIGKNVGYLDMKCINCNSYFNYNELYKRRVEQVWKPKPITNADRIRAMTPEELAELFVHLCCPYALGGKVDCNAENKGCYQCWLNWLRQEAKEGER